jgi:hypothetical protein
MLDTADPAKAIQQWTNAPDRAAVTDGDQHGHFEMENSPGGQVATLRFDGDNIYIEALSPERAAKLDTRMTAELKKEGTKYTGTANSLVTWTQTILVSSEKNAADRCTFTEPIEITSVTPALIEGREFTVPKDAILDRSKCTFSKPKRWINFVWVPE